jgi:hypothetical protein
LHQIGRVGVRNKRTWPNAENQAIGQAPDTKTDKVDWG